MRSWLVAGLSCALFAVETFAVVHPLDMAAHANGEPCKICVGVASLGAAAVTATVDFVIESASPPVVAAAAIPRTSPEPVRQTARGPPFSS